MRKRENGRGKSGFANDDEVVFGMGELFHSVFGHCIIVFKGNDSDAWENKLGFKSKDHPDF